MKILFVGFVCGVIFILSNISENHVADGQYFPNVDRYFVPIEFESSNRGIWNASHCLRDLLNCWELTKADYLCAHDKYKVSICDFWRDNCDDKNGIGKLDDPAAITLFETYCRNDGYQNWT